jgi:ribosomal protein S18 acetylase RimI-like enzyme
MVNKSARREGPCPECGFNYVRGLKDNERYHSVVHDREVNGNRTSEPNGFLFLTHTSPMRLQRLAGAAAASARSETEYDSPAFNAIKKRNDEFNTIAGINVLNGRVCALAVTRIRNCDTIADLRTFEPDELGGWWPARITTVEAHQRRTIEMIWVLRNYRRRGIANQLVHALAEHCEIALADFAHMTPFREDALRFWTSLNYWDIPIV